MKENFDVLIKQVNDFAKENLKESRYQHSLRVADYAKQLADLYASENVNTQIAYLSGLAHDMCKNYSDEALIDIVKADGLGIDEIEKTRINLLHGKAAAIVLNKKFAVTDESILKAIAFHTFGYKEIDALGKIVYIADKIEPERPNTQKFRSLALTATLNELMFSVLSWNMDYIKEKGGTIHPETQNMYNKLNEELENKKRI